MEIDGSFKIKFFRRLSCQQLLSIPTDYAKYVQKNQKNPTLKGSMAPV